MTSPTVNAVAYPPELLEALHETLADFTASEGESEPPSFELIEVQHCAYSTIAVLSLGWRAESRRLVAKTIAIHPHNQRLLEQGNQALVEFESLRRLHASFEKIAGCSVPRPIAVLPDKNTYVMEFVDGELLDAHLKYLRYFAPSSGFRRLSRGYYLCGSFLKHLHEETGTRRANGEVLDDIVLRCDDLLDRIQEESNGACPRHLRDHVKTHLDQQRSRLNGAEILTTACHGDFGPWNILATAEGITVLDFFGFADRPMPIDILRVLTHLELERLSLTSRRRRVDALRESFLAGYGRREPFPEPLLLLCETLPRLTSLLHACILKDSGRFHHRVERRRCIRRQLQWLTDPSKRRSLLAVS